MKILLLTNMFTPYMVPLFNAVAKNCVEHGWKFKAVSLCERESNRGWDLSKDQYGFDYTVLPGWQGSTSERGSTFRINVGVFEILRAFKPDVVIANGYDSIAAWQAFIYCKVFGIKYVIRNGTTMMSVGSVTGLRGFLKKIIIGRSDGYIAYGKKAAEYLKHFGADVEKISISINTVDMNYFRERIFNIRNDESFIGRRSRYPRFLLLYSGQLVKRKGVIELLNALKVLDEKELGLIVLGSGPLEMELKQFCLDKGLSNVYFEGFKQHEELARYYALADVLILPSLEEVWGLVVNEALAAGQYVLCSKYAGAGYDLITDGFNGELFDPKEISSFPAVIRHTQARLKEIQSRRINISERAAKEFSIERAAQGLIGSVASLHSRA